MVKLSKQCTKCKQTKSNSCFYKKVKGCDELSSWCKACTKVYGAYYRKTHANEIHARGKRYRKMKFEQIKEKHKEYRKNNQDKIKLLALRHKEECTKIMCDLKVNGCTFCGYNKNMHALEFHHVNQDDKKYNITYATITRKDLVDEINKCLLLCANCHRIIHHQSNGDVEE